MSYLHSKGIAYLDINTENVLLTAEGVPMLANFGLALRIMMKTDGFRIIRHYEAALLPRGPCQGTKNFTAGDAWAMSCIQSLQAENSPFRTVVQIQGAERVPQWMRSKMINDASFSIYFCVIFLLLNFQPERRPSMDIFLREISLLT